MTCSIAQPLGFPVDRYRVCLQILPNPGFKARRSHWRQSEWQNGCHLQHVHLPQALPHCNRMFRGKSTCPSRTRPTKGKSAMKSGSWLAQIYIFERILTKRIFPQLVSETSEFVFPLNSENFVSEKSGLRVNPQQMSHIWLCGWLIFGAQSAKYGSSTCVQLPETSQHYIQGRFGKEQNTRFSEMWDLEKQTSKSPRPLWPVRKKGASLCLCTHTD